MNNNRILCYIRTMTYLIKRDLRVFQKQFLGKCIDTCILLFTTVIVFGYILTPHGLGDDYGPFILVGAIAGFGFFDVIGKVSQLLADIEGEQSILYTLSLPIPSWLVFFYIGLSWSLVSSIICLVLFPVGKVLLYNQFDLSLINYPRLLIVLIASNLFFGFFALWLTSILKNMSNLGHLFVRIVNPMYMFGGYFYSWYAILAISPLAAYLSMVNPLLYVMEGMRAAILGQKGYLPFWFCVVALNVFTIGFGWHATKRLQKRLDTV